MVGESFRQHLIMNNPITQLQQYWLQARRKKDPTADYFLLASVDARGKPHVRTVLIKSLDQKGIGFVTNKSGPKIKQFRHSQIVEGCIVWPKLSLQVRVAGKIRPMPKKAVQKLWNLRPREAQLLYHLGLKQSSVIPSYEFLLSNVAHLAVDWRANKKIPLAPNYVGFLVEPKTIEFLHHHPSRLNRRELYQKDGKRWSKAILAP